MEMAFRYPFCFYKTVYPSAVEVQGEKAAGDGAFEFTPRSLRDFERNWFNNTEGRPQGFLLYPNS